MAKYKFCITISCLWVTESLAPMEVCFIRECLPDKNGFVDMEQALAGKGLCYKQEGKKEAYAYCNPESDYPICRRCDVPPCDSTCESPLTNKSEEIGAQCESDTQCKTKFAECYYQTCRRVLMVDQLCEETDICAYGKQRCFNGRCLGVEVGEPCWDGYPEGFDLDCETGHYCFKNMCLPQLPVNHSCKNLHPNECILGTRCNLETSKCNLEYSLENGMRASRPSLCKSSYTEYNICVQYELEIDQPSECDDYTDCRDGHACNCKQWWMGPPEPHGYCEVKREDTSKEIFMKYRDLRIRFCHHGWSKERCALEYDQEDLLKELHLEELDTVDPTTVPNCAKGMIVIRPEEILEDDRSQQYHLSWIIIILCCFG